jgi:hypothetical protein
MNKHLFAAALLVAAPDAAQIATPERPVNDAKSTSSASDPQATPAPIDDINLPAANGGSQAELPVSRNPDPTRRRFLEMFARAYFPGRTGHLMIVPREGDIITRADPNVRYMHGSPWTYDVSIPLMFAGPAVRAGIYSFPAVQQDVAPPRAAALGVQMPPTITGRILPVLRTGFARPRVIMLVVLDGMRRDYFDRYARSMPTLTTLRQHGAWFSRAEVNFLPTNTAAGHSTISTGTDPRSHGITGVSVFDRSSGRRHDLFAGGTPQDLMALTLADVWQLTTDGRAIVLAQGSIDRAATPLAGHGSCQLNGRPVVLASYNQQSGRWTANATCFRLPAALRDEDARTIWSESREWMGHRIDTPEAVRYSGLFPAFEADAMITMIENEALGDDDVADLLLLNYKGADFVGHAYGPDSSELAVTLSQMDRHLARIIGALERKVGRDYLIAITADHGMPSEPSSPDRRHLAPAIVELLHAKFDPQEKQLVESFEPENGQIFVNVDRLSARELTLPDLARFLESQPFLYAAFTREEVRSAAEAMTRAQRSATREPSNRLKGVPDGLKHHLGPKRPPCPALSGDSRDNPPARRRD